MELTIYACGKERRASDTIPKPETKTGQKGYAARNSVDCALMLARLRATSSYGEPGSSLQYEGSRCRYDRPPR